MKTNIDILYSDEDIVVINKPSGMLSIPDRFEASKENLSVLLKTHFNGDIFVVHRIDRETSGILCFARTADAHKHLNNQFLLHKVDKTYYAFIDGHLDEEEGTIDARIAPHPYQEGKMIAGKVGKEALTHYKVRVPPQYAYQCDLIRVRKFYAYIFELKLDCSDIPFSDGCNSHKGMGS